jgi:hypothetical protein
MLVLIGCEHSGAMRRAFRALGHDAWSCDLLPPTDGDVHHHLQCDVLTVLGGGWELAIFHPDCTYLTWSAEWAYGDGPYHMKVKPGTLVGVARRAARERAADFAQTLWGASIPKIAIENPRGYLAKRIGRETQTVQPHWFGDDASKATSWWLKNLPLLTPTHHVAPRMVNGRPRWANQTDAGQNRLSPSLDRWALRATTYPGIAAACAQQWGGRVVVVGGEDVVGRELEIVKDAYRTLLLLPLDSMARTYLQPVLAGLRDEIARQAYRSPEEIQNAFEAVAAAERDGGE